MQHFRGCAIVEIRPNDVYFVRTCRTGGSGGN
jgi:hypothetical protein